MTKYLNNSLKEKIQDWWYYTFTKPLSKWWYWFKHDWEVRLKGNFVYKFLDNPPERGLLKQITLRKDCLWYDLHFIGIGGDFSDDFPIKEPDQL